MKAKDFIHESVVAYNAGLAIPSVDVDGATVDLQGFEGGCMFIATAQDSLDTLSASLYLELEVEESENDSDWTDVADADLSNYVAGNNDGCFGKLVASTMVSNVYKVQYKGSKRYCRCVLNVTGTMTNGMPVQVSSIKLGPMVAPQ